MPACTTKKVMRKKPVNYFGVEMHNMYGLMQDTFKNPLVVAFYVVAVISLFWHLLHGFQSAFRTFGVSNKKYLSLINCAGIGFSIIVPLAFAMMPLSFYFGWV